MYKIVLIRHGESQWNKSNRFAGWSDVDLTADGVKGAQVAGKILKDKKYCFDVCYTSFLKRAIKTLNIVLEEMDLMWIPVIKDWRLNERHYGNLQGANRKEIAKKFGEEQLLLWRRSYSVRPPEMKKNHPFNKEKGSRYNFLKKPILAESLKDVVSRVVPFWKKEILAELKKNKKVLIVASGNSIRALTKYLNNMSEEKIMGINIPYAIPIVYELDKDFKVIKWYYLGDQKKIKATIDSIKNQGKIKK
jgi:2,3-bisphosphoglycerate-dependent phosphoglycerate mutase